MRHSTSVTGVSVIAVCNRGGVRAEAQACPDHVPVTWQMLRRRCNAHARTRAREHWSAKHCVCEGPCRRMDLARGGIRMA